VALTRAPVVIVPLAHKQAYLDRYALPDKAHTPLAREEHWPAPYWDIDTGMAALLMLLTAVDAGFGALFFGVPPEKIAALRERFGIPDALLPIGTVAVGYPKAGDPPSPSLERGHRAADEVVHRGQW
jgi:nitroreductase